jgi:hypothetical protein
MTLAVWRVLGKETSGAKLSFARKRALVEYSRAICTKRALVECDSRVICTKRAL